MLLQVRQHQKWLKKTWERIAGGVGQGEVQAWSDYNQRQLAILATGVNSWLMLSGMSALISVVALGVGSVTENVWWLIAGWLLVFLSVALIYSSVRAGQLLARMVGEAEDLVAEALVAGQRGKKPAVTIIEMVLEVIMRIVGQKISEWTRREDG